MSLNEALNAVRQLSKEDRLSLADMIYEEDAGPVGDLTPAQRAELDRRLHSHRADPAAGTPWEQVREETRVRRGR